MTTSPPSSPSSSPQMLPISQVGHTQVMKKLTELRQEMAKLPAVIQEARAHGDLKENAEYHAAREKQGLLNAQIMKLQSDINRSRIIDPQALPADIVTFGKKVSLTNLKTDQTHIYYIVGPAETEFFPHSLSITSQIAKGLLAKKAQATVTIVVPAGEHQYRIDKVEAVVPELIS